MSNLEETVVEKQLDESEISLLKAFLLAEEQAKKDVAIDEAGFFTVENDVLVEGSGLNYYYMNKARKILIEERILQMVFGGIPRKCYYRVNHEQMKNFILTKQEEDGDTD